MKKPDLIISIVNHSNPELLHDCLRTLFQTTKACTFEVWVVDNATDGRGVDAMRRDFPQVRWLFNSSRKGFSANHNQVLSQARGRYFCIFNDDTLVHEGAFDALVRFMDENPRVGMAGARLLNADGTPQDCVFREMGLSTALFDICFLPRFLHFLKALHVDPAQYGNDQARVSWVLGACIVVREQTLSEVGLLDEKLSPLGNTEDTDWCVRAWKAGWEVAFCPEAVITHLTSRSFRPSAQGHDRVRVELWRTRLAYFRKHHGRLHEQLMRLILVGTLPWNSAVLTQSLLRRRLSLGEYQRQLSTFVRISEMGLRARLG
ncbi:glycosyltransferase family 2 protein [Stigmatella aurantiaca]|uniref:Glycosyl transferase, group 2 family protein n=1 Tax=Stigmatella aurantiaca (strain DW4/3-1) TaxID=378806 RepID=Q09DB7_STIAD|nr:glycosyltransferase family 2 protein [Stigmatella aurantiaca]ADO69396.1 Glycosyl transferase, group 2 family protein [Stigmatella aurantiaca DW4/3-1]EAU69751.1 glycosyl transferase, group 2 family, putative [Stigmatella aurantiaca DW4/3-1]